MFIILAQVKPIEVYSFQNVRRYVCNPSDVTTGFKQLLVINSSAKGGYYILLAASFTSLILVNKVC